MAAPRRTHRPASLRVKPLVLALAGVFPVAALHAAGPDVRLPTQHGTFTPTNSAVTVSRTVSDTAARLDVSQTATRAITQWSSFNVGAASTVNFYMPTSGSAMLARVMPGTAAPQQILGSVNTYVGTAGSKQVGGELFLVNAGGWIFGRGANVNVGGLVASTLDVRNDDFLSGLGSIDKAEATFSWKYAGGVDNTNTTGLYQANGLVQVDAGANISTESGGRVFLFAPTVVNSGKIATPDGQTVLAGGGEVFLNNPLHEKLYASEVNPNVPALRGLLVEVNNGPNGERGSVTNAGDIITARGNTTLVGMAVRQSGRISADTSGASNGSVFLTARSGVVAFKSPVNQNELSKLAQQGGSLVLDKGSSITLLPDESSGATTVATPFTASRVVMSGKTIDMLDGAKITAPGAIVQVRAEAVPAYLAAGDNVATFDTRAVYGAGSTDDKNARITLGAKAVIDVSGTTTAQVDAAKRNFVTPSLITNSDLKDAPLQKDGPLFHSETATFDIRQNVPMLSSLQGYKDAAKVTVTERMAAAGSVDLRSTGAVVTNASSVINISGGQVNYSAVGLDQNQPAVQLTRVVDKGGNVFTLNNAPADRSYTGLVTPVEVHEAAYVQGAAAGKLSVTGNQLVMTGQLKADTVTGVRQAAGLDALAARAKVSISGWASEPDLTAANIQGAVNKLNMRVGKDLSGATADFWTQVNAGAGDAAVAGLAAGSVLDLSVLNSQAASVAIHNDGAIHWLAGNNQTFVPGATVSLVSNAGDGLRVDSSIRNASGVVTLKTGTVNLGTAEVTRAQGITLGDGQSIDVSGRFVNQQLDGTQVAATGIKGGDITIQSSGSVKLGEGSVLDVSGGAVWSANRSVSGKEAGSITLSSELGSEFNTQAEMRGFDFAKGGKFSLTADTVNVGGAAVPGATNLSAQIFGQQGFGSFTVNGRNQLTVAENTLVSPVQKNMVAALAMSRSATDTAMSRVTKVLDKGAQVRTPTSLTLGSSLGTLKLGQGAVIRTDPLATVNLSGATGIDIEGSVIDHGGTVSITLNPLPGSSLAGHKDEAVIWLGHESLIDVSGQTVLTQGTGSLRQGKVLDGGTVNLTAGTSSIADGSMVIMSTGSVVKLDGAADRFDTKVASATGTQVRKVDVASAGGSLNITTSHGAVLEGDVSATGGASHAVGGKLNLKFSKQNTEAEANPDVIHITLQDKTGDKTKGLAYAQRSALPTDSSVLGNAVVSSDWLNHAGFADVSLTAGGRVDAAQTTTIAAGRSLNVAALALNVAAGQTLTFQAPQVSLGDAGTSGLLAGKAYINDTSAFRQAITGTGTVNVAALNVELNNHLALQGVGQFNVTGLSGQADSAAALLSMRSTDGKNAGLDTLADISIRAAEVFPSTDTRYTLNATGHTVRFGGGNTALAAPMSAGGSLTINADAIEQGGVLRAPFGAITLNAKRITLQDGSLTSVSGEGLLVPFGSTVNGSTWVYTDGTDVRSSLQNKQVTLNAGATGTVKVEGSAKVDASGGGDVYAREFIAGPGGSKDIFAGAAGGAFAVVPYAFANQLGFAAYDRAILSATDAAGKSASIVAGQQITFGNNGVLPAGTYVVLPAAYANMPGAYLVKADAATARAGAADLTAPSIKLDDGSASVAGMFSYAGTSYHDTVGSRFIVMDNAVSGKYSQINLSSGNGFFSAVAAKSGATASFLARDGGTVSFTAAVLKQLNEGALSLAAQAGNTAAQGGTLELGLADVRIGGAATKDAGASQISLGAVNASGADTVLVGANRGERAANGERNLNVTASAVSVSATGEATGLTAKDITLVAKQGITLGQNVAITSSGANTAEAYHVDGDGASVRVSGDAHATLSRSKGKQLAGDLTVADGVTLSAKTGKVLLEGTRNVAVSDSVVLDTKALSLGAAKLALGAAPASAGTLNIGGKLLAQVSAVSDLSLKSFSSIDFYKPAAGGALSLGDAKLNALTLDAGSLQGHGGVDLNLTAGSVTLANTSGAASASSLDAKSDTGTLTVTATQGDVVLATGAVSSGKVVATTAGVGGFQNTVLKAQRSIVASGQGGTTSATDTATGPGGLNVAGNLTLDGASLTATSGSNTRIEAAGKVIQQSSGQTAAATSGLGAHLVVKGQTIQQDGTIDLRSGALTLLATGSGKALSLGSQAKILAQGTSVQVGSQTVDTQGGSVKLLADAGNIALAQGSVVNVSAAGAAAGGQLQIQAAQGSVALGGRLVGTAQAGKAGSTLSVDAQSGVSLDALADTIAAEHAPTVNNFSGQIALRSRGETDLSLGSQKQFSADAISVVSDGGNVTISGGLHADTATGGSMLVAAKKNLSFNGASVSAKATATDNANPFATGRIDLQSSTGTVSLLGNTKIDQGSATSTTQGGVLAIRASRTDDNADVKVAAVNAEVKGARSVQVEGVKLWTGVTTLNTSGAGVGALALSKLTDDATAFSANAAAIQSRLSAGNTSLAGLMTVRAGQEVRSTGDLLVNDALNLNTPMNLTLRAGKDLLVSQSISSGFSTTAATGVAQAVGADLRLVAGADSASANAMATNTAGKGDLLVGTQGGAAVVVRTTTGDVQLAAAHDVRLQSTASAVYTTGLQATATEKAGLVALPAFANTKSGSARTTTATAAYQTVGTTYQSRVGAATVANPNPFYTGGGNVTVAAGNDVLGSSDLTALQANPANWLYTSYETTKGQVSWFTRSDTFTQGVATLGGGNVKVNAGGSVQDLTVAAAGAGFKQAAAGGASRNFGAGTVAVSAGQDILGTLALGTGASTSMNAGGRIGASARGAQTSGADGSTVLSFNGVNTVNALGNIGLAAAGSAVRASQYLAVYKGPGSSLDEVTAGYAAVSPMGMNATLALQSAGGDILVKNGASVLNTVTNVSDDAKVTNPSATQLVVTAPSGNVSIEAKLDQRFASGQGGQLTIIAGHDLTMSGATQQGGAVGGSNDASSTAPLGLDEASRRDPVVLVAGQGDLTLGPVTDPSSFRFVRPLLAEAGRDIVLNGDLTIQHQSAQDLSVFQAGRDVLLIKEGRPSNVQANLTVRGPGDLLMVAGRDINLGVDGGVLAEGNGSNSALPAQSVNVTLMAGTKLSSLDASLALAEGRLPQLLGGLAFVTALAPDAQVKVVREVLSMLGASVSGFDAAYDADKAAYMGTLGAAYSGLSAAQRVAAFDKLPDALQQQFKLSFLAAHVLGKATAPTASSPQDFNLPALIQAKLLAVEPGARAGLAVNLAKALNSPYLAQLRAFVASNPTTAGGVSAQAVLSDDAVFSAFASLPVARQALFMQQILYGELRTAGRHAVNAAGDDERAANYQRGYDALASMFSPSHAQANGDILMPLTKVRSFQGGNINLLAPAGSVNGGLTSGDSANFGVVALGGGQVNAVVYGNYLVNTSRVFTVGGGDLLMWSSEGNIDAGKGARTVQSAPAPVYFLNKEGKLQVDVSASIAGSGIASSRDLDVYAPHGIVDSGDAGLRSAGAASLGGARVVCIGCFFGGGSVGLPVAAPVATPVTNTTPLPDSTKAGAALSEQDDDAKKKKRKRQLQIDFLGFGVAFTHPMDMLLDPGLSQWWAERQAKAGADANTAAARAVVGASDQPPAARRWLTSWLDKPVNRQ